MSIVTKLLSRPFFIGVTLFFISLAYYGHAALHFPTLFNLDNPDNFAATRYIVKHHKIPVVEADDKEIFFSESGTTRLSRPPFTYIVSAVVASLTEGLIDNSTGRLRLGSPLMGALAVAVFFTGFWLAFTHLGLALLGAAVIGLLPKFVFLASCNNDDIGAILSVSLMFTSFIALIKYQYQTWVLVTLACALGLLFQTKYTAWLTLPWFGIYGLVMLKPVWPKLLRLMPVLLAVCIAAGGWWVIFNMYHYGLNDPSGLNHIEKIQSTLIDMQPNRQGYLSRGIGLVDLLQNHDQYLSKSYKSLIGYLEWLDLDVGIGTYLFYSAIFLSGIIGMAFCSGTLHKRTGYLDLLALALIVGQCWFFMHHNLLRDVQPQGRYVLPIIMPMVYLFLRVLARVPADAMVLRMRSREFGFQTIAVTALLATCLMVYVITLTQFIAPSFIQKPFYTSIKNKQVFDLETSIKVVSASAVNYRIVDKKLVIKRTGVESPTLVLNPEFCQLLPVNALITINLSSPEKGGFHLRLDRNHEGTYDAVYWHSFPAGQSTAVLTVSGSNCTGVKLTLGKNTYGLTLEKLQISELRIHEHGMSI